MDGLKIIDEIMLGLYQPQLNSAKLGLHEKLQTKKHHLHVHNLGCCVNELWFGPTFNHDCPFSFRLHTSALLQKKFIHSSGKIVLELLPPTNPLPCFGLEVLSRCHIFTATK